MSKCKKMSLHIKFNAINTFTYLETVCLVSYTRLTVDKKKPPSTLLSFDYILRKNIHYCTALDNFLARFGPPNHILNMELKFFNN